MNKNRIIIGVIIVSTILIGGGIWLRIGVDEGNQEKNNRGKVEKEEKEEKEKTEIVSEGETPRELPSIAGLVASYEEYDRQLTVSDFAWVGIGTKMKKVVGKFGEPNGMAGSGFLRYYYELSDGSILFLYDFGYPENENSEIWKINLVSRSGRDGSYGFELEEGKENHILGQVDAKFEKYDRELQLASLESILMVGMNFNEVEDTFGKPNSYLKSNKLNPYYELADGSFMVFENTDTPESGGTRVSSVKIIDRKNRVFKLIGKAESDSTENE